MATVDDDTHAGGRKRMQDFIFARELAEVYLLLDHLSGRSDKSLAAAFGDGADGPGSVSIHKICEISWPVTGTVVERGAQAETLLLAKDRLNAAAKPANGASIAFTLMVAGDDEVSAAGRARGFLRWLRKKRASGRSMDKSPAVEYPPPPPPMARAGAGEEESGAAASASEPVGIFGGYLPSRISLATLAYPGLIVSASRFKRRSNMLLLLLFVCLILTCVLSWDISAGRAILARLDAVETARAAIQKRIADAEVGSKQQPAGSTTTLAAADSSATPASADSQSIPGSAASPKHYVQRYCERATRLPPPKDAPAGIKIDQFEDLTQLYICDQLAENRNDYRNAREDMADWLAPWGLLKWAAHRICEGRCLKDETVALPANAIDQQQWAAIWVELLATAVLPLCYGFLGAGAAVVRNIWGKMRDSLLSPRDLTLSLGQLALGAVIGACIGLFTPTGVGSQATGGLAGSIALTPSALSFIGGFGVEGVFVMLESVIKRVFNIPDQKA
jgi:hypothetical protein